MDALLITTVLLLVLVGAIIGWAGEFGKGGEVAKNLVMLVVLCVISGYIVALASGSI